MSGMRVCVAAWLGLSLALVAPACLLDEPTTEQLQRQACINASRCVSQSPTRQDEFRELCEGSGSIAPECADCLASFADCTELLRECEEICNAASPLVMDEQLGNEYEDNDLMVE